MAQKNRKSLTLPKPSVPKLIYVMICFAILTVAASALFFSTNIIRVEDGEDSKILLSTTDKEDGMLKLAGINIEENDNIIYTSFNDNYLNLTVLHSFNVPITVDGGEVTAEITQGTVNDCLAAAGVVLGEHDYTVPSLHTPIQEGDSIRVYRVSYIDNTYEEAVRHGVINKKSSLLFKKTSKTYTMQEGSDGINRVTYRERYVDGELELALVSKVEVIEKPVDSVVLSYGAGVPVSDVSAPRGATVSNGVPTGYSRVISMSASGYYSARGRGASGLGLYYGTCAVNPNVIPYGTKMYIASPDGKFVYGWAIATDTGTAMMEHTNYIDLFYESYLESYLNGRIAVNVYVYG